MDTPIINVNLSDNDEWNEIVNNAKNKSIEKCLYLSHTNIKICIESMFDDIQRTFCIRHL